MATADSEQLLQNEEYAWSPSRPTGRNYWGRLDPSDFVTYPEFESLSYYEEMTLIRKAQAGDLLARNEIWQRHLRLVFSVVNRLHVPIDLMSDALQEGAIGIERAIRKFDLERYGKFSTYAWPWIWQHIQRFLHTRALPSRIPSNLVRSYFQFRRELRQAAGSTKDTEAVLQRWRESDASVYRRLLGIHTISTAGEIQLVATDSLPTYREHHPQQRLDRESLITEISSILNSRSRYVVVRRFALDGRPESTLEELGIELKVTRERIRQIEQKALLRLKRMLPNRRWKRSGGNSSPTASDASPQRLVYSPTLVQHDPPEGLDQALQRSLELCSDRQRAAIVRYFGLLGKEPMSVPQIATELRIPIRKVAVAIRQAIEKLSKSFARRPEPEIQQFVERLSREQSWKRFL